MTPSHGIAPRVPSKATMLFAAILIGGSFACCLSSLTSQAIAQPNLCPRDAQGCERPFRLAQADYFAPVEDPDKAHELQQGLGVTPHPAPAEPATGCKRYETLLLESSATIQQGTGKGCFVDFGPGWIGLPNNQCAKCSAGTYDPGKGTCVVREQRCVDQSDCEISANGGYSVATADALLAKANTLLDTCAYVDGPPWEACTNAYTALSDADVNLVQVFQEALPSPGRCWICKPEHLVRAAGTLALLNSRYTSNSHQAANFDQTLFNIQSQTNLPLCSP